MWSNQPGLTGSRLESRPMPKRRFDKLDPELRGRILKAAALEFGTHGYADASLNRIVEQAGISKGSMYYYFEDKEDLFSMVLQDLEERSADLGKLPIAALTAENYWSSVSAAFRAWLRIAVENPWVQGFLQLFSELLRNPPTEGPLVAWYARMEARRTAFLTRGQELGTVRRDLPVSFLADLMHGLQMVQGRYFMKHSADLTEPAREQLGTMMIDLMRRILEPAADPVRPRIEQTQSTPAPVEQSAPGRVAGRTPGRTPGQTAGRAAGRTTGRATGRAAGRTTPAGRSKSPRK